MRLLNWKKKKKQRQTNWNKWHHVKTCLLLLAAEFGLDLQWTRVQICQKGRRVNTWKPSKWCKLHSVQLQKEAPRNKDGWNLRIDKMWPCLTRVACRCRRFRRTGRCRRFGWRRRARGTCPSAPPPPASQRSSRSPTAKHACFVAGHAETFLLTWILRVFECFHHPMFYRIWKTSAQNKFLHLCLYRQGTRKVHSTLRSPVVNPSLTPQYIPKVFVVKATSLVGWFLLRWQERGWPQGLLFLFVLCASSQWRDLLVVKGSLMGRLRNSPNV